MAHGREGAGADGLRKERVVAFFSEWLGLDAEAVGAELRVLEVDRYEQARPEVTFPNVPLQPLSERGCVVCSGGKNMLVAAGDWAAGQGVVSSAISSGIRAAELVGEGLGWTTTKMKT